MSLVAAVESSLESMGGWEKYAAEVAAVRMLAVEVEDRPSDKDLWREFRLALKALREASDGGSAVNDSVKDLLARLGDAGVGQTAVRD